MQDAAAAPGSRRGVFPVKCRKGYAACTRAEETDPKTG